MMTLLKLLLDYQADIESGIPEDIALIWFRDKLNEGLNNDDI